MKVVILAGGLGTRLSEETDLKPKPLVEVGGRPLLWHVMQIYSRAGFKDFIVCCGYRGDLIKQYFANYYLRTSDIRVDLGKNAIEYLASQTEDWTVTLVDTGEHSMTGGRLKRVAPYIGDEAFCLTYGDGVSDIDVGKAVAFHKLHGKKATVTAVPSPGRFGILDISSAKSVARFHEKPNNEMGWINGGFFVLEPSVLSYIEGDSTVWERGPLERLSADGELMAYQHSGYWKAVDTLRDKRDLEAVLQSGAAPWLPGVQND